jgi:Zn finger protein HypA/HybF involved in hydrogenase expression
MNSGDSPNQKWTRCTCNHCSGHLEFDAAHAGETIQCPHCKLDTVLFVSPGAEKPSSPPTAAPPMPVPSLVSCPDCGGMVSRIANRCPHCGRPTQRKIQSNQVAVRVAAWALVITITFLVAWLYLRNMEHKLNVLEDVSNAGLQPSKWHK